MRKVLVALLALVMMASVCVTGALAADYTYTVRIYAGNRGDIGGQPVVEYHNVAYGTTLNFSLDTVNVTDNKYYVQGIRYSGRDNDALQPTSIYVTGDADYVVAYGIVGTLVQYTVNYQDANGNALAASQTYFGNIGEKPVIAFLYIDGYQPQAYNLTRTLSENAAQNVFTFVYTPIAAPTATTTTTTTPAPAASASPAPAGEEADEAEDAEPAEEPVEEPEEEPNEEPVEQPNEELTDIPEEETPLEEGPQELIDLDEEDTPLGNVVLPDDDAGSGSGGARLAASIGVMAAGLGGLAGLAVFFLKKRKNSKDEQQA